MILDNQRKNMFEFI